MSLSSYVMKLFKRDVLSYLAVKQASQVRSGGIYNT